MEQNDNITSLYNELKDVYELKSEDDFRKYLSDSNNREALRKELETDYEVGDSASFSKYLGFDQEQPADTPAAEVPNVTATPQPENGFVQPKFDASKNLVTPGTQEWRTNTVNQPGQNPYNGRTYGDVYDEVIANYGKNMGKQDIDPYAEARAQIIQAGITDDLKPEEVDKLALNIRHGYANRYADNISKEMISTLPDQVPNIDDLVDGLWYNRDVQARVNHEAARLGLRKENYVNYYLKPHIAKALSDRYGYDVESAKHIAGRLLSQEEHTTDAIRRNEAAGVISEFAAPIINEQFKKIQEVADKVSQQEREGSGMTPYGNYGQLMGGAIRNWQATDPEKVWQQLKPVFDNMGSWMGIVGNEEMFDKISQMAEAEGMPVNAYIDQYVIPAYTNTVQKEFERIAIEREMPKNTFDYIIQKMGESLVGSIGKWMLASEARRRAQSEALQRTDMGQGEYKPGYGARIAGGAAAMLPDMLLPYGGPFGAVARFANRPVEGMAQYLITNGWKPLFARMAQSSAGGMASLGAFEGVKGAIQGAINPEGYESILAEDKRNALEILGDIVKGGFEHGVPSAVMGATMVGGPLGQKISNGRGLLANILGWGTQVGVDAAGATALSAIQNMPKIVNGDITADDLGNEFLENVGTFAALGLHGKAKEFASLAGGGRSINGVPFSKSEVQTIEDVFGKPMRNVIEDIDKLQKSRSLITKSRLGINADTEKQERNDAIKDAATTLFGNIMKSYQVPADMKVRMCQAFNVPLPEYALKPTVLETFDEAIAKSVDTGWIDKMNDDYNRPGGVVEELKNEGPQSLNDYELTLRLLFQDNKRYNEIGAKLQAGEELTPEEMEFVNSFNQRLQTIQGEYFKMEKERLMAEFEKEKGLKPGTIQAMIDDLKQGKGVSEPAVLEEFETKMGELSQKIDEYKQSKEAVATEDTEAPEAETSAAVEPKINKAPVAEETPAAEVALVTEERPINEEIPTDDIPPVEIPEDTVTVDPQLLVNDETGNIVEVTLTDGRKAYIKSGDPANEYGRVVLVDEQGEPIKIDAGNGYTIDRVPTNMIARDENGNQLISQPVSVENFGKPAETTEAAVEQPKVDTTKETVPVVPEVKADEKGQAVYEESPVEATINDLRTRLGSDEEVAETVDDQISDLTDELAELTKKPKGKGKKHTSMNEKLQKKEAIKATQQKLDYWNSVKEALNKPAEEPVKDEPVSEEPVVNENLTTEQPVPATEQAPTAEETAQMKIAHGNVKSNLGKNYEFQNQDGTRSIVTLKSFKGEDGVEVMRQDFDAEGNPKGKPYSQELKTLDVSGSIINGYMKPALTPEEQLREQYKGRKSVQDVLDVVTDDEMQKIIQASQSGDSEAFNSLINEYRNNHVEDLILKDRDERNAKVSEIMNGPGTRENKLRRIRKIYQEAGLDDAVVQLEDDTLAPVSVDEIVADLHNRQPKKGEGPIAYFSYTAPDGHEVIGMQDESGHGNKTSGDTKGYAPWLAPKGKGMSLTQYAENIRSQMTEAQQEQYDVQDVRNAIINLFGSAEKPSDITTMSIKNGVLQAEQAARRMEDQWIEGVNYQKVSPDDKSFAGRLAKAKETTNTEPTEAQKENGNYKKGHVSFGGYDFVIENPEGSMRRGKDATGKEWEQKMNNTYGYILGKYGKDGDHLDMFINDAQDLDGWDGKVYVVDQVDPKTGEFDEHKVMYGFNSEAEARQAYLSNYEKGWKGLGAITGVNKEAFDKWLDSSKRKLIRFADHSITKEAMDKEAKHTPTDAEIETAMRDQLIGEMVEAGIKTSTNYQADQAILDRVNGVRQNSEQPSEVMIKSHKVDDAEELKQLENQPTVKRYRAMQLIDGKLYPPMSAKVDGEMRQPTEIGVWEKAEERPDLVKNGKFVLNKAQKGQGNVPAAYNPYFHTSTSGLNDQFTSAYKRPELVVVEVEIPESELTSGYKAEGAKDAVGDVAWHSGVVNGQLPADRQRQVTLSRYSKVNRIVPDNEVANMIAKQLEGTNVEVPYNVVTPSLRVELEKQGVKISDKPAGSVTEDANGNRIRQQKAEAPIFVSNALKAVEAIKQDKATPDQWLAMIQKNGGLKAGEDKWIGLSEWLEEQKKSGKSVTKQEVMDYIRQNQIEVEETHYSDNIDVDNIPKMQEFRKEYDEILDGLKKEQDNLQKEMEDFNDKMYKKYGDGWATKLNKEDQEIYDAQEEKYGQYQDDLNDLAFGEMVNRHGDDFSMAFEYNYGSGKLQPTEDMYGDGMSDAAKYYLEMDENPIDDKRLEYTTPGLQNYHEIALTVPTIKPYETGDTLHFGDAGDGRAVAWVRFGDATIKRQPTDEELAERISKMPTAEQWEKVDGSNFVVKKDIYYMPGTRNQTGHSYIVDNGNGTFEIGGPMARRMLTVKFPSLEDAVNAFNKAWVKGRSNSFQDKVLVIDEIQSKRHQDGRSKGYDDKHLRELDDAEEKANRDYHEFLWKKQEEYGYDLWYLSKEEQKRYGSPSFDFSKVPEEDIKKAHELQQALEEARKELSDYREATGIKEGSGVPDAPFEKNWHELAMKRMLRYAAENGYDKIAWTTGEQQTDRYDLAQVVRSIRNSSTIMGAPNWYTLVPQGGAQFRFHVGDDGKIDRVNASGYGNLLDHTLSEVFGKDAAPKIEALKDNEAIDFENQKIGGEGMKGFYDDILPRFMNKYGKKWGVKVYDQNYSLADDGHVDENGKMVFNRNYTFHTIDVTPEMKESVMEGQPMFFKTSDGYAYGFTYKGEIHIDPRIATSETPIHEYGHLWAEMKRQSAPEEWDNIKQTLLADKLVEPFIEKVKRDYPELTGEGKEDDFVEEVLTQFSGKHGAEKLRKMAQEIKDELGGDATAQTIADTAIRRVKSVLNDFWKSVCGMMGWKYTNAEDIADAVLRDLLNGVNPVEKMKSVSTELKNQSEVERTLMGVHNISEEKLKKALKLGGLANPSLAVIDTKNGIHTDYGEISLIPRSSLIDAKTGRNAGTYAGDAWTPTYPSVTKEMTSKGEKHKNQIAKQAAGGNEELEQHLARTMERHVDDNDNRLHLLYLIQKGIKPELMPETTVHTHDEYEALRKILGNDQLNYSSDGLTKEQNDAILDLMMKDVREKAEAQGKLIKDEEKRQKAIDAVINMRKNSLVDPETGKIWFAKYDSYIYDVRRDEKKRQNPKIDWYKTDNEASYRVAKENLAEDYEKWKEQLFADEDIAEKLFAGWTPDGTKKYVKNTVENASRLMNKEKDTNAYGNGGLSASKAMLVKKLKSLAEIRKYRHLLKKGDDIKEQLKQKEDEWFDIIHQVSDMQKIDSNPFINVDIAEARLQEAMEQRDPIAYMNKEYGYHIDKDSELASQLMNFMEEASQIPVKYFETKFKRPVGIEEFAIAVVPTTTSPEVIKALEDKGLEVHTYDKGSQGDENDEARKQAVMDAVQRRDDIMFQKADKLNNSNKGRIIPDDVDKNVSLQIEKRFDNAIEEELKGLSEKEKKAVLIELDKMMRNFSVLTDDSREFTDKEGVRRIVDGLSKRRDYYFNKLKEYDNNERQQGVQGLIHERQGNNGGISSLNEIQRRSLYRLAIRAIDRENEYRDNRLNEIRSKYRTKNYSGIYEEIPEESIIKMFNDFNSNESLKKLFDNTLDIMRQLGVGYKPAELDEFILGETVIPMKRIKLDLGKMGHTNMSQQASAGVILHEMLHQATNHMIALYNHGGKYRDMLSPEQQNAVKDILELYQDAASHPERFRLGKDTYGLTDEYEFTSEVANAQFREELDKKNFVQRIWDFIRKINPWAKKLPSNVEKLENSIQTLLDSFAQEQFDTFVKDKIELKSVTGKDAGLNKNMENQVPTMSEDFPKFSKVRKPTPHQMNEEIRKKKEERNQDVAKKRAAEEGGIKEPNRQAFEVEALKRYDNDVEAWKQRHGLSGERPTAKGPEMSKWLEAEADRKDPKPNVFDYTGDKEYRQAYDDYLKKIEKYKPEETPELTKDDVINEREMQVRTPAQKITTNIATTLARDYSGEQASDAVREGVIERRRNIEELSADDSLYINNLKEQTDNLAKELSGDKFDGDDAISRLMNAVEARKKGKQHISGKDIRDALPFIVEAPMRRRDIARDINDVLAQVKSPCRVSGEDLKAAEDWLEILREEAPQLLEINRKMADEERTEMTEAEKKVYEDVKQTADGIAYSINHRPGREDTPLTADDVMAALSYFAKRIVPKGLKVNEDMPELQGIINGIRDWYRTAYTWLDEAGMRKENVGYFENYVNHVWSSKKSDPDAYDTLVANRQPTTSRNMKQRQVRTYMEGIEAGLVPEFSEVTDMMGDYSKKNILAWANKKMLNDLSFIDVIERNDEGEVIGMYPMMSSREPGLYGLDKYKYYEVPGVGALWVYKDAADNFSQIFEQYEVGNAMKMYDNMASLAKKIELSWSGFHAGALSEVYAVQNSIEFGPKKTAQYFYKYLIKDCLESGLSPAYANPEDYRSAAKHFVKLGATDDYSAPAVQNMSDTLVNAIAGLRNNLKGRGVIGEGGALAISPLELAATAVKLINEGSDKILWTWLHDGLKIATFKMMEDRTNSAMDARFQKQHPEMSLEDIHKLKDYQTELNKQLDRDGQYVNDMFGGQHWELINISPKVLRRLRRFLLSPDWLMSTQRHFLGAFGYGDIHSKARLRDFNKFYKAILGDKVEFDSESLPGMYAALIGKGAKAVGLKGKNINEWAEMNLPQGRIRRSMSSLLCYAIGVNIFYDIANNIVNAIMRKWDEEQEEQKEKENEGYVSKYKLMYPDGMKWFDRKRLDWNPMHMFGITNMIFGDYGMEGNALGKKTHVFGGHYDEGAEIYLRTGKQFKEFPDFWENEKGELEFPRPLINRLMGKANPNIRMLYNTLNYYTRWDKSYDDKELEERIKKFSDNKTFVGVTAGLTKLGENYKPFWVPTQEGKNWVFSDTFFPSSKGFSAHKAREYFEQFMRAGDQEGYMETVRACILNGMSDEKIERAIKSAENGIKAEQRKQAVDDQQTLEGMMLEFNGTNNLTKRKALYKKIYTELGNETPKAPKTYDEFQEWFTDYLNGVDRSLKVNDKYLERATAQDMTEEARISQLKQRIRELQGEIKDMEYNGSTPEQIKAYRDQPDNMRLLKAHDIINTYENDRKKNPGYAHYKKELGKESFRANGELVDDAWRMRKIREMRQEMLKKIEELGE